MSDNRPEQWAAELEREAVRAPEWRSEVNRPQAEAISVASVWQMESPETADQALSGADGVYVYRRDGHPNERTLADKLAKLHGGTHASITAQGMSAVGAVALGLLSPGDVVWIAHELYGKSIQLFAKDLARWGVDYRSFDPLDSKQISELASSKAALVMVETISNPRLRVPDIVAIAEASHQAGAKLVVDNTFATHLICRPIDLGADLVIESLGKQVNGHSDAMVGLVVSKDSEDAHAVQSTISTFGMASSPLDCYLTHRGLSTLAVRVERANENALAVAERLDRAGKIRVDYPGLSAHPQNESARRQLKGGFGWMLTFHLECGREGVLEIFDRLRPEIPFVPSLGDVSSSVSHPASTSHRGFTVQQREALGIYEGTIRLSCGIEPTEWLVDKVLAALDCD
ncbi:MAG: trans-sulfuration enzyme family protein [Aureliella sp.]